LNLLIRLQLARDDFTPRWEAILHATSRHPVIISGNGFFSPCPASLGTDAPCANNPPLININGTTIVYSNADHRTFNSSRPISGTNQPLITPRDDLYRPTANIAQTILAAVRIDLGNPSRNNFFLNRSVLNTTLFGTFPANKLLNLNVSSSILYDANVNSGMLPLAVGGPAHIQVLYLCQLQQLKSYGSLVISVLVATLSMFSAGWAFFMLVAGFFAERANKAGALITFQAFRTR
jgi:hypothetical protein